MFALVIKAALVTGQCVSSLQTKDNRIPVQAMNIDVVDDIDSYAQAVA